MVGVGNPIFVLEVVGVVVEARMERTQLSGNINGMIHSVQTTRPSHKRLP